MQVILPCSLIYLHSNRALMIQSTLVSIPMYRSLHATESLCSALLVQAVCMHLCCLLAGLQLEESPLSSLSSLAPTESVTDILARVQHDQLPQEVAYSSHSVPSNLFRRKQSAPAAVTTAMSRLFSSGQRFGSGEYTGSVLRCFEELVTMRNPMCVHMVH